MNTRLKFLNSNPGHIFYSLTLTLFLLLLGHPASLYAQYYNFVNFKSGSLTPSVQENAGSLTLIVVRDSSDPLPAATITYRTEPIQAVSPDDYNGTSNDNGSLSGVLKPHLPDKKKVLRFRLSSTAFRNRVRPSGFA
jgi:hypothetical protein